MTRSEKYHLSQRPLSENDIDKIKNLNKFLAEASFEEDKHGLKYCSDDGLKEAARPLFTAILTQEEINSKNMRSSVLKFQPGTTPLTSHSVDLIPVDVRGSNPTIDGMELALGSVTHITKKVKIEVKDGSALDLLFLAERKK